MALTFAGRDTELARLERLWFEVRDGRGPRAVVVLADAGLGKTRLIHEFYRRCFAPSARDADPLGYWPDDLGSDGDNLLVQPAFERVRVDALLRHLWWGIRLPDPIGVNAAATGVLPGSVARDLLPHVDAVTRFQRGRQRTRRALATAADLAVDLAVDAVPFGGLVKSLLGAGAQWREQIAEARAEGDAAVRAARRDSDLHERLLADFRALLAGPEQQRVPTVLFIDDGQFSPHDRGLVTFVSAALDEMTAGAWPLLLLVTHWAREYHAPTDGSLAAALTRRRHLVLPLGPVTALADAARAALPGLTPAQVALLEERAGGNPRLLDELVRYLTSPRRRGSFVAADPRRALTPAGEAALAAASVDLHERVAARLAETPAALQRALALAAHQGAEFLPRVVAAVADALPALVLPDADPALGTPSSGDPIGEAERPHALVARPRPTLAAFVQRVVRDVALEFLPAFADPDAVDAALRAALRSLARAGYDADIADPDDRARFYALTAATFDTATDVSDRQLAAASWDGLIDAAASSGDVAAMHAAALRQVRVLAALPDEAHDGDLAWVRSALDALESVGDVDAAEPLLARFLTLTQATLAEVRDAWSTALHVDLHLRAAAFARLTQRPAQRRVHLDAAFAALGALPADDRDERILDLEARVARQLGHHQAQRGEPELAASLLAHAARIRAALADGDPAGRLALIEARVDALIQQTGSGGGWLVLDALDPLIDELRVLAAGDAAGTRAFVLAKALILRAGAQEALGRFDEAQRVSLEADALLRGILARTDTPDVRAALAHERFAASLRHERASDAPAAAAAAAEAIALLRPLIGMVPAARGQLIGALAQATDVAVAANDVGPARALAAEALTLARAAAGEGAGASELDLLLWVIRAALPLAIQDGEASARALIAEARAAAARIPPDRLWLAEGTLHAIDAFEAHLDARGA
jgi:hypothetical protein